MLDMMDVARTSPEDVYVALVNFRGARPDTVRVDAMKDLTPEEVEHLQEMSRGQAAEDPEAHESPQPEETPVR